MLKMCKSLSVTLFCAALMATGPALAQGAQRIAEHKDWGVYVEDSPKVCYIASLPQKSAATRGGKSVKVKRGDIRLYVAFRKAEDVANEVSFVGGYPFKSNSSVKLAISGKTFVMSPGTGEAQEWAWTAPSDDANAVAAMRAGNSALITGVSSRGTTTTDTFSLSGFTAALKDATDRCK